MKPSPCVAHFEALLRSAPGIFVLVGSDSGVVAVNDTCLRALSVDRGQAVGKSLFELFADLAPTADLDGRSLLEAAFERVLETSGPAELPPCRLGRSGSTAGEFANQAWEFTLFPVLEPDGTLSRVVLQGRGVAGPVPSGSSELEEVYEAIYDQGLFAGRLDLEGTVIDANRSFLEVCGFRREEIIGRRFWDCGWWNRSPEVQAWVKAAVEQAAGGEPFRGESTYFWSDGTERIVEFACMPIRDDSGRVSFVLPTGIDVTERSHSERHQRAAEILESITDAFFGVGADWRFTYVNRQAERVLDREPGELIGKVIWDVFPGLIGSEFERAYRLAATEGVSSTMTRFYPDHRRWYEVHTYPARAGISIYFRDVSGRKQAELEFERLTAESEKLRRIYEAALSNTPDLVYVFDLDHRFSYANEALLSMWGRTGDQALGRTCLELGYEPWHAAMHDDEIDRVVATKQPIRGEVPFEGTNGRRDYDYIFAPVIGHDGRVVAVAGTTRDVTDRKQAEREILDQAEQLRQNDRRKDEFLAMLAHELRNPLSAIGNAVTVIKMTDDADNLAFAKDVIERQVRQLSRLVDDLLDVSRITTGKIRLRREYVDAGSILRQAIATVRPLIDEREHDFHADYEDGTLPLRADATRLEQIVVNLLTNASKYTQNGGVVGLSAKLVDDEVVIEVRDNGMGIPPEKLPEMFQLFVQGERSIARSEGGLGIGLTIVQKLTEMHGGTVTAASEGVGKGSTFTIRLPAAQQARGSGTKAAANPEASRSGSRILVVDDNQDTARGLARLLKLLGNEVEVAHDGPAAIRAARSVKPEFVLLDIGLPGMNGYEVAAMLRDDECCKNALIIAISGYGQAEDRRRSAAAGIDHHLVKPVDFDSLVTLIGQGA